MRSAPPQKKCALNFKDILRLVLRSVPLERGLEWPATAETTTRAHHALHLAHWAGRCFNCRCTTFPTTKIVSQISRALLFVLLSLFFNCMYSSASLYHVKFCLIRTYISGTISRSYFGVSRDGWWLYMWTPCAKGPDVQISLSRLAQCAGHLEKIPVYA